MATLIYVQSSGFAFSSEDASKTPIFRGYSGADPHKDDPKSQCLTDRGPIPRGRYTMELLKKHLGMANVVRLIPDENNEMCGRTGFLIHGGSINDPGNASRGCIIADGPKLRESLVKDFDDLLVISHDRSDLMAAQSPQLPFYLGSGYRVAAGKFGARIINQSAITSPPDPLDASVKDDFGIVLSQEDFEKVIAVDASISGSGGSFSADASASLRKQYRRSETSVALAFTRRVTTGIFRLHQYPVDKAAKKESSNALRFVRTFGDSLVDGVGVGGACCYLFRLDFRTESEASEFKASIKARYGASNGSYSQSVKKSLETVKASVDFAGYTTGTLNVPSLFDPEKIDGTKYLFSRGFSDRMIAGLLAYYDNYPSNFEMGEWRPGYSQCNVEMKSLYNVPKILKNQDKIAQHGEDAADIADALTKQEDYLNEIKSQMVYSKNIKKVNPSNISTIANEIIREANKYIKEIIDRRSSLLKKTDLTSKFDFRNDFPSIPDEICTVDPEITVLSGESSRGNWMRHEFDITTADEGRTCWIEAHLTICAVGHRPNGGNIKLQLLKENGKSIETELRPRLAQPRSNKGTGNVIEEKEARVTKGGTASITVGKVSFVASPADPLHQLNSLAAGNYGCGSKYKVITLKSRQKALEPWAMNETMQQ